MRERIAHHHQLRSLIVLAVVFAAVLVAAAVLLAAGVASGDSQSGRWATDALSLVQRLTVSR